MIPSTIERAGFKDQAELSATLDRLIQAGSIRIPDPPPPPKPTKAYKRTGIKVPYTDHAAYMRQYRKVRKP